jgi:hypothetical protein
MESDKPEHLKKMHLNSGISSVSVEKIVAHYLKNLKVFNIIQYVVSLFFRNMASSIE